MDLLNGLLSIFQGSPNKADENADDKAEGIVSSLTPELTLDEKDEDLLKMAKGWKASFDTYQKKGIDKVQEENENYWLGMHYEKVRYDTRTPGNRPVQENRIFADIETFLPIATRQNPEPTVSGGEDEAGQELADKVRKMLIYLADTLKLRLKIKRCSRHWMIYQLGAVKHFWNYQKNNIDTKAVRPKNLILDPEGYIDEDGYMGDFIGEYKKAKASHLAKMFPSKAADIKVLVKEEMGTKIGYIEWWTNDFVFWEVDRKFVLGKAKNPHWNYEKDELKKNEGGAVMMGEDKKPVTEKIAQKNHFETPKIPYSFLAVFSLGDQPHDNTGLVQQNLSTQDSLNKRLGQIDKNVDEMQGGVVVSGEFFNESQAAAAANAIKTGKTIWQPKGKAGEGIQRYQGEPLPSDVYSTVNDLRLMMDNVFGIHGASRGEKQGTETLGGQILRKNSDADRVSLVSDYIEQFVDDIYNWWVQLMYVYYDEQHAGEILGAEKMKEYVALSKEDLTKDVRLLVSVQEGSLIPKDPLVKRNEAMELAKNKLIDPITLFERLDWPNPRESALKLVKYNMDPKLLFPEIAEEMAKMAPAEPLPADGGQVPPEGMPGAPLPADILPAIGA